MPLSTKGAARFCVTGFTNETVLVRLRWMEHVLAPLLRVALARMYQIVVGLHPDLTIPALEDRGIATGIDIRKVIRAGVTPVIDSGLAHRNGQTGHIGFGYVRAPLAVFERAVAALQNEVAAPRLSGPLITTDRILGGAIEPQR
jgi:hypothetical protein